jgi:TRAP-type C4-dicarboxylate transport system permease large subunit
MSTTFRGVVPFLISDGIRILLLVFVPPISLFLVRMFG